MHIRRIPVASERVIAVRPGTDELALLLSSPHANDKVVIVEATGSETDLPSALPTPYAHETSRTAFGATRAPPTKA